MKDVYRNMTSKERVWINRSIKTIRYHRLAYKTEQSYCGWIRRYILFLRTIDPRKSSKEKVEAFLTYLVVERQLARSTQDQAFNALRYFYTEVLGKPFGEIRAVRSKRPARKRTSVAPEKVRAFLEDVPNKGGYPCRLIGYMLYGMGLRLDETLSIRIKDVDFAQSRIVLRVTKGNKDRIRPIPCNLVEPLREQVIRAKGTYGQARLQEIPVKLPGALARRYPNAKTSFSWFWLFPLKNPSPNPRNRSEKVWWHCLPQTVQAAFQVAARKHDLEAIMTPHVLRHCWASHEYEKTRNIVQIQQALAHKNIETTRIYIHQDAEAGCQGEHWKVSV